MSLFWFTSSQSNLDTHLQRWILQRSPQSGKSHYFSCGSNTYKASKELRALQTPHKHIVDNSDMGRKILQHCCVHLSPAVF